MHYTISLNSSKVIFFIEIRLRPIIPTIEAYAGCQNKHIQRSCHTAHIQIRRCEQWNKSKEPRQHYNSYLPILYSQLWTNSIPFFQNRNRPWIITFSSYPSSLFFSPGYPMGRPQQKHTPSNALIPPPTPHAIHLFMFPLKASPPLTSPRLTLPMPPSSKL